MKSKFLLPSLLFSIVLFSTSYAQDLWPIETLRTDIVGAWSRAGDFDNDGDPDILVQAGDSIYWHENLQPGWEAHLIDPTFYNSAFAIVVVNDLDGDEDLDVLKVTQNFGENNELTWNEKLSDGSSWEKHVILNTPKGIGWLDGSFGDLDGDGDLDIVIPEFNNGMGSLYWLENIDTTDEYTQHPILTGDHFFSSVADLDGDGDLDIVSGLNELFWLENKLPNNTWEKHIVNALPGNFFYSRSFLGDINGDGTIDIVSNYFDSVNDYVSYYSNPNWQEQVIIDSPFIGIGEIGDIDNDGDIDVTYGNQGFYGFSNALGWAENHNNGSDWVLHNIGQFTPLQTICTDIVDIDGDNDPDLVALNFDTDSFEGSVFWLENPLNSTGTSNPTQSPIQISVSPNPASDLLHISIKNEKQESFKVQLFDMIGHLIYNSEINDNQPVTFHLANLPDGNYLIKIFNEYGTVAHRVAKL